MFLINSISTIKKIANNLSEHARYCNYLIIVGLRFWVLPGLLSTLKICVGSHAKTLLLYIIVEKILSKILKNLLQCIVISANMIISVIIYY